MPKRLAAGTALTFMVRDRHGLCQIIKSDAAQIELVVFDAFFIKHPTLSDLDGQKLYVSRTEPRNQPFYFLISDPPSPSFKVMGSRPVALAFPLPKTFRTTPNGDDLPLPVESRWNEITAQLRADFKSRGVPAEPYTSTHFPEWTVDPATLRRMDQLIDLLQKALAEGTGLPALATTATAFNLLEDDLTPVTAKQLATKLLDLAVAAGLDAKKALKVIDGVRSW